MVLAGERRDRYKLRPGRHSGTIIDCRHTRAVVRNPERPGRTIGNAPWIDEVWVDCRCRRSARGIRAIRDQIGLREGDLLLVFVMVMDGDDGRDPNSLRPWFPPVWWRACLPPGRRHIDFGRPRWRRQHSGKGKFRTPVGTSDNLEYFFGHRANSNDLFVSFFTIG